MTPEEIEEERAADRYDALPYFGFLPFNYPKPHHSFDSDVALHYPERNN